jgi:hypothetical protein
LANGDSRFVSNWRRFGEFHQFTVPLLLRSRSEKGKKGGRNMGKHCAVPTQQNGGKNEAQKNEKEAAELSCSQGDRYRRTGRFNSREGLSGYRASCERIHKSAEDQITNTSEAPVELTGASLIKTIILSCQTLTMACYLSADFGDSETTSF